MTADPSDYKSMIASFVIEAIQSGETEQSAITSYVQDIVPWASADDVVDAAHRVIDVLAQTDIERGSGMRRAS